MVESFFAQSAADRTELIRRAAADIGGQEARLEKDIWVVWALDAIFSSPLAADLTFKGGTSLSKAYKVIDRFSEDVDLTYDIRKILGDIEVQSEVPPSSSQANKWTDLVRKRLPGWIAETVAPVLNAALARDGLAARLEVVEGDKLEVHYEPVVSVGYGYMRPIVTLEFGGRSSGEPNNTLPVVCDISGRFPDLAFPTASPVVMRLERTFWEKATAAHVYCAQTRWRGGGERYARHWHDLGALGRSAHLPSLLASQDVAKTVAMHKSRFFREKDEQGQEISYEAAATGYLKIVPEGEARRALEGDYRLMREAGMLAAGVEDFDALMHACAALESQVNAAYHAAPPAPPAAAAATPPPPPVRKRRP